MNTTRNARQAIFTMLLAEHMVADDLLRRASKLSPVVYTYRSIISELCRKRIIRPLGKRWVLVDRPALERLLAEDVEAVQL